MGDVELSTNEFKALSSTTRTDILKILDQRNYTLSELSAKTGMAAPTVKQHASILVQAGMIEQMDEGRKWKYYTLTRKGRTIIRSKERQANIMIILSSAIMVCLLGLAAYTTVQFYGDTNDGGMLYAGERASIAPGAEEQGNEAEIRAFETAKDSASITAGMPSGTCIASDEGGEFTDSCLLATEEGECNDADFDLDGMKDCKWEYVN